MPTVAATTTAFPPETDSDFTRRHRGGFQPRIVQFKLQRSTATTGDGYPADRQRTVHNWLLDPRRHVGLRLRIHGQAVDPQHPGPIMNPIFYLKVFAWIAIVALCCAIFSDFWLPMLIGAVVITALIRLGTPPRD